MQGVDKGFGNETSARSVEWSCEDTHAGYLSFVHLLNAILANFNDVKFAVLSFYQQQRTAGSLGGQWGWDDEDDDDVSASDVPEVEYKVSDQMSSSFAQFEIFNAMLWNHSWSFLSSVFLFSFHFLTSI